MPKSKPIIFLSNKFTEANKALSQSLVIVLAVTVIVMPPSVPHFVQSKTKRQNGLPWYQTPILSLIFPLSTVLEIYVK